MITKTTGLDSKYNSLFEEIEEKSNGTIVIPNIDRFFGNLTEIAALDEKYLMMPLDEPMFEIDANSRKITIPDEFKSNGISIQGDHLAETVFFKIDRYFDYMDLSSNKLNIVINWKLGDEAGQSHNFIKNMSIAPGYIIFGWPISKSITNKSGNLSFAVQIYQKDTAGNYLYNFNTQPATISIKDGLILNNPQVINNSSDILNILTNSVFTVGSAAVEKAEWLSGDGNGLVAGDINADFAANINLPTNIVAGVPSSNVANLYAYAESDGAVIDYKWSVSDGLVEKPLATVTFGDESVQAAHAEVNKAGSYQVTAQGAKYDNNNNKIGSGESSESAIVKVNNVVAPTLSMSVTDQKSMSSYEVLDGNYAFLKPSAGAKLKVTVTPASAMLGPNNDKGAFKYIWKKDNAALNSSILFEEEDSDERTISGDEAEGVYSVDVVYFKNGQTANAVSSESYTVCYPADAISGLAISVRDIDILDDNADNAWKAIEDNQVSFNSKGALRAKSVKVKASIAALADGAKSDSISYVWETAPTRDSEDWDVVGNNAELSINAEGFYRIKVKNNYKGSAYVLSSSRPFYAYDLNQEV